MLPRPGSLVVVVSLLAFAAGAGLIAYGRWSRPAMVAEAAAIRREPAPALAAYGAGEARFRRFPVAARLLPGDYAHLAFNQLALLYRSEQYDAVIEKAETAPPGAAPHFWSGCALFAKSTAEETPDDQLVWLGRAADEFKRALENTPDDFDAKYNYELCARLAASLRRDPLKKPSVQMPLLRPQPNATRQPIKKVG